MMLPSFSSADHELRVMIAPKCPLSPHDHRDLGRTMV
jgi:hypothetical protein